MHAKRVTFLGMRDGLCEALLRATAGDLGKRREYVVAYCPGSFKPVRVLTPARDTVKAKVAAQVTHAFLRLVYKA